MKKIRNNYKLILLYLITIVILFGFSFLIVNLHLIKNKSNVGVFDLKSSKHETKEKEVYDIDNINRYVDTISFDYNTNNNIGIKYKIKYLNKYGKESEESIKTSNTSRLNKSYETIRKNVVSIKIITDNDSNIKNIKVVNKYQINLYLYLFLCILFLNIYMFIFKRNYFSKKIEKGFLLISLSVGLLLIICQPPFLNASWDDQIHFKNVYSLGNDDEKYTEIANDYSILNYNFGMFNTVEERRSMVDYVNKNLSNTSIPIQNKYPSYNKICYLPVSLLFIICDYLNVPFIIMFLLGKLLFLIIYTTIVYFAIKLIPRYKHLLCLIGLLPTSLFLASNFSYDTIINSFILLFMAVFVREKNSNEPINGRLIIISLLGTIIACFTKAIYAPLILIMLLLPKEKFSNIKKCRLFRLGIIIITFLLCATFVLPTITNPAEVSDTRGGDTSEKRQIKSIIDNPISFVETFSENYLINMSNKLIGYNTTTTFAYYDKKTNIISNTYIILLILLFFYTLIEKANKALLKIKEKIYILFIILFIMAFIWGAMYLSFTQVGSEGIAGVQGRYFIPLLFPLLLLFKTDKIESKINDIAFSSILYFGITFVEFTLILYRIVLLYCL